MYEPLRDLSRGAARPQPGADSAATRSPCWRPTRRSSSPTWSGSTTRWRASCSGASTRPTSAARYFRQFWDVADAVTRDPSSTPADARRRCATSTRSTPGRATAALGTHNGDSPTRRETGDAQLVLVDPRRAAQDAIRTRSSTRRRPSASTDPDTGGDITHADASDPQPKFHAMFHGRGRPDIRFFGFDLTIDARARQHRRPMRRCSAGSS